MPTSSEAVRLAIHQAFVTMGLVTAAKLADYEQETYDAMLDRAAANVVALEPEPETPAELTEDHPIRLAFDETHGQDPMRKYSVSEVKRIVYPLVGFIRAQEAELVILRHADNLVQAMIPGAYILPRTVGYIPEPTPGEGRPGRHRMIDPAVRVLCTCDRPTDHNSEGEPVD